METRRVRPFPIALLLTLLSCLPFTAQETAGYRSYSGKVVDSRNGKPLVFATLEVENGNLSTITNSEGDFLIKIPQAWTDRALNVSFLGYADKRVSISSLDTEGNEIALDVSVTQLEGVQLNIPKDPRSLVLSVLANRGERYLDRTAKMTAFYRETIKRRRRNVSLSEAVVTVYKAPYSGRRRDAVELFRSRKSTDYSKLDTLALKLQGGPFNTLFGDIVKYPEFIFEGELIDNYDFRFERTTKIGDRTVLAITFKQRNDVRDPYYDGTLYIDPQALVLISANYALNIFDRERAALLFVRKKPSKVDVWPTAVAYRVDYRERDGKWYYGYSNANLEFKVDWQDRLFNSVYSMTAEMAVTDWAFLEDPKERPEEKLRKSVILEDEASGFSDPEFWGRYNIIEPEKSIESAIKKIQRQLRRARRKDEKASLPEVWVEGRQGR